ncbi:ABC transporter permease [Streptomyces hilarionis]|uniref:ABC transporter permease n=1 Tax=Streptomyces hilarionis TaxID=2839954 RepID=UPI00211A6F69|nr:ABC transporter permease [Streptomyces hilarionis]MCQ9130113.1 FtsX-like permease family protein [Streptomyces hilarionis]
MLRLALGLLRARPSLLAGPATVLLMAVSVITMFGSLIATAIDGHAGSRLGVIGGAFGEIAMLMTLFTVTNTLSFAVRGQARDMALLRTSGATPAQIRRLIRCQILWLTLFVSPPAWLLGAWGADTFMAELAARDIVPADAAVVWSPWPLLIGTAVTLLVGVGAAKLAARRVVRGRPSTVLAQTAEQTKLGWLRGIAGLLVIAGSVPLVVFTSRQPADKSAQLALLGSLLFLVAVGLLGPLLARLSIALLGVPFRLMGRTHGGDAGGALAADNLRGHAHRLSSAVVPIALLVGLSSAFASVSGTLEQVAPSGASAESDIWLRGVELAMLAGFGAVATVNTLASLTTARRREYALLALTGATRRQLLRMLGTEAVLTALAGVVLGILAAAPMSMAFAWAARGEVLPTIAFDTYAPLVLGPVALTVLTILFTGVRATSEPAVTAVAAQ